MTGAVHRVARYFRDRAYNYILWIEQLQPQNEKPAAALKQQLYSRWILESSSWKLKEAGDNTADSLSCCQVTYLHVPMATH